MDNLINVSKVLVGWIPIIVTKEAHEILTQSTYSSNIDSVALNLPSKTESIFDSLEDAVQAFIFNGTGKFKMNIDEDIVFVSFKYQESDIESSENLYGVGGFLKFPFTRYDIGKAHVPSTPPVNNIHRKCIISKTFKCKTSIVTMINALPLNHTKVLDILKIHYPMISSSNTIFSYEEFLKGLTFEMIKNIVSTHSNTEIGANILNVLHIALSKLDSSSELYEFYTIMKGYTSLINGRLHEIHDNSIHEIYLDAMEMLLNKILSSTKFIHPIL